MCVVFLTEAEETGDLIETTEKSIFPRTAQSNVLLNAYFPDIDECHDGSHMCRYTQVCQNTVGGYGCVCPRGYRSQGVGLPCLGKSSRNIRSARQNQTPPAQIVRTFLALSLTLHNNSLQCFSLPSQTSTSVCSRPTRAPTSAVTSPAPSGACARLEPCCSGTGAPAPGWRGA